MTHICSHAPRNGSKEPPPSRPRGCGQQDVVATVGHGRAAPAERSLWSWQVAALICHSSVSAPPGRVAARHHRTAVSAASLAVVGNLATAPAGLTGASDAPRAGNGSSCCVFVSASPSSCQAGARGVWQQLRMGGSGAAGGVPASVPALGRGRGHSPAAQELRPRGLHQQELSQVNLSPWPEPPSPSFSLSPQWCTR